MPPTTTQLVKEDHAVRRKSLPARQEFSPSIAPPTLQRLSSRAPTSSAPALMPSQIPYLQRTIGNQAVQRLLESSRPVTIPSRASVPAIQPKLEVGPAHDRYEQEADHIAQAVVSRPQVHAPSVQRNLKDSGVVNRQPLLDTIQRNEEDESEVEDVEDDYEPSNEEIRKKMGLKFWLMKAALHGATGMDRAKNKLTGNQARTFTGPVNSVTRRSVHKAKNNLYQQHQEQGMSGSERRKLHKEQRQAKRQHRKEMKIWKKNQALEENGIEV